jgi:hypothetical protein
MRVSANKGRYLSLVDESRSKFTGLVDSELKAPLDDDLLRLGQTYCAIEELSILSSQWHFGRMSRSI